MANQIIVALPRVTDANGDPVSGALAVFYQTGTTTPITVYSDEALSIAHPSPLVADSSGVFAQVFYGGTPDPKYIVKDADGATLYQADPAPMTTGTSSDAENIGFSPISGNAATNVQTAIENNTALAQSKVANTLNLTAGIGLTGGGDLSAPRSFALDTASVYITKVLLATRTASASATLDFTEFVNATYHTYEFYLENVIPGTDGGTLWMRTSTDGGSTYDSGAGAYAWTQNRSNDSGTASASGSASATRMELSGAAGNAANEIGIGGVVALRGAALTAYTSLDGRLTYLSQTGALFFVGFAGLRKAASDVDAVQFLMDSGTLASGIIRMYGLK